MFGIERSEGYKTTEMILLFRGIITILLVLSLVISLGFLLTQLNDPNPNAALTALLGSITGALGTALVNLSGSFASHKDS